MAFNFNWSPLTADAGFYTRAQDLLTTALNKSPKPPIIVDDIIVTELNLGSTPPELEILEIGDLAEDRFRGIFKMCYNGDAFLTLKTRVQANPLSTYLSTRPLFASPRPLAAATGLTIPIQITLSDIKLSAFIILVFSKQKGLTLVFRNDPLESLKVSSTFDSIPFVRDYLQKEIEGQLRILLMDELPAIIHRLSLQLFDPENGARRDREFVDARDSSEEEKVVDPLASPPQDAVDANGNPLNSAQIANLSLDSGVETQALFSRKNLLRLATLTDSHRTLSLFTPSIPDAVFRAWAGPTERGDLPGYQTPARPALSRSQSYAGSTAYSFQDIPHSGSGIRSPVDGSISSGIGLSMGASRHGKAHGARKRKKRVVNLRRTNSSADTESISEGSTYSDTASSAPTSFSPPPIVHEEREEEPVTPPRSPLTTLRADKGIDRRSILPSSSGLRELERTPLRRTGSHPVSTPRRHERSSGLRPTYDEFDLDATPRASMLLPNKNAYAENEKVEPGPSSSSSKGPPPALLPFLESSNNAGILEQAWMMKMATEIARKIQEDKERPPPAYGQPATFDY